MSAVKSVHRNLQAEDAACKAMDDAYAKEILEVTPAHPTGEPEPMDIMAARDVHVYHGSPANSNNTSPTPVVQPVIQSAQAAAPMVAGGLSGVAKAAVIGSALIGGTGIGAVVANYFNQPESEQAAFNPADWQLQVSEQEPK
jgi:hypothetical protein